MTGLFTNRTATGGRAFAAHRAEQAAERRQTLDLFAECLANDGDVAVCAARLGKSASWGGGSASGHSREAGVAGPMIDLCLDALTPGYARVYSILAAMAEAGEPCPGNVELARLTGYQTHGGAVHAVTCLKRAGLIEVYRGQNRRIVRIISTGKETKGEMPAPGIFRRAAPCFEQKLPPRVRRDPCPRCGVRGDLGCRHAPAGWGA